MCIPEWRLQYQKGFMPRGRGWEGMEAQGRERAPVTRASGKPVGGGVEEGNNEEIMEGMGMWGTSR